MSSDADFLRHEACEDCGSSDAKAVYSDHHTHCFSCNKTRSADGRSEDGGVPVGGARDNHDTSSHQVGRKTIAVGDTTKPLISRLITEDTCRHFGYTVGDYSGRRAQFAPYYNNDGELVATKIRFPNKDFVVSGSLKDVLPFGAQAFARTGKIVVVTEGEIDAMTMSQVQGNKWPVVSVATGAAGARNFVAKNLDYFNGFESVVLMLDNDTPGKEAAQACAEVLGRRAKIARLPADWKDPNAMLVGDRTEALVSAMWQAEPFRPDGLVHLADIKEKIMAGPVEGLPWPFPSLTKMTYGRRLGEIYAFGAGTGIGKTDFFTQVVEQTVNELGLPVGLFFLEQEPVETAMRVLGKFARKRFHVPNDPDAPTDGDWNQSDLEAAYDHVESLGKIHFYDSFGINQWDVIQERIRYLKHAENVEHFFLDHLTALAAAESDERRSLELIMAEMGGLVKELKIIIYFVSHLATPDGKPHEEGGRVMIRHFKGSRAIGYWSHFMFGLERDQQSDDFRERTTTTFRVLKDRYTGQSTGQKMYLGYDAVTGMMYEADAPMDAAASAFEDEDDKQNKQDF